jgi:hypothetical protein
LLAGAAALFWGWQTGQLAVGVVLGLLLEAPRFTSARIDLSEAAYRRVADYCAVALAALVVLLVVNRGMAGGVLGTLQWLPLAIAPIVLAQRYGTAGLVRASALLLYLRRQLRRDPATHDAQIDITGPHVAAFVVAAGAANDRGPAYYAGTVLIAAWALYALRPRAAPRAAFAAMLAVAALLGYAGHIGLNRLQASLEAWIDEWLVILPADVERTTTRIGSVGRLKQHDAIALRLYGSHKDSGRFKLLHAASFNEYRDGAWIARAGGDPGSPAIPGSTVSIVLRVQGGRTPLPLPLGTVQVEAPGNLAPESTGLGVISIDSPPGWLRYEARYGAASAYPQPGRADYALPPGERAALERLARELRLGNMNPAQALLTLQAYFSSFKYSTWREREPAEGMTALEDFLMRSRTGHCEYFAAATTLLLRAAGVPARYATGYAAFEYSELERAWVVRARHAHAWTRAHIDGRWIDVDLTPPTWPETESELQPAWERLADFARWLAFLWANATLPEISGIAGAAGIALLAVLGWWLMRRRAHRSSQVTGKKTWNGADSEFYAVMDTLAARYRPRAPHESVAAYLKDLRLSPEEGKAMPQLLELHYRYRFDPAGLPAPERAKLRALALSFPGGG